MGLEWLWATTALMAFYAAGRWLQRAWTVRAGLPGELASARLAYGERSFRSGGPLRLVARVDRAYRVKNGRLVLLELKTRGPRRVYLSDVIELSAQRFALMAARGEAVAEHGYVLTMTSGAEATGWHRVTLLPPDAVLALAARRERLLAGKATPQRARNPGLCQHCAYLRLCRQPKDEAPGRLNLTNAERWRASRGEFASREW